MKPSAPNPQRLAGQAWAAKRAEPKPVPVSVVEPAPMRRALVRCPGCSAWIPETIPEGRHAIHHVNVEGGMVLQNCSGEEVKP